MGRPSNTAARRDAIARAFQSELAENGYDGATIARVAARAGLASGLVHYHFGSKEEILVVVVERIGDRLDARIAARGRAPRARLHMAIDALLAVDDHADLEMVRCWVVIGAEALRRPEVALVYGAAVGRIRARLAELLAAAGVDDDDAATALLCAIQGAYHVGTASRDQLPAGRAAPAVKALADAFVDRRSP